VSQKDKIHDLVIVGAGPVGLAVGIEAKAAGFSPLLLEKGNVTDTIRRYPVNMTFFSTPELLELGGLPFPVARQRPTRVEALEYYRKVAACYELEIRRYTPVQRISRSTEHFTLDAATGENFHARSVVVATGYFDTPNRLEIPGEDLPHVSHYYDEAYRYSGIPVVIVGGAASATEAALELYRCGADVTIVHRDADFKPSLKYWLRPDIENRIKAGSIKARFRSRVTQISEDRILVEGPEGRQEVPARFVFLLTGYRPDTALLKGIGVEVEPVQGFPSYNQETFETNVPGLFIAGSVACGCETGTIFIENGRTHARPIIAQLLQRYPREPRHKLPRADDLDGRSS